MTLSNESEVGNRSREWHMKAMAGFGVSPSQPTVATLADGRTRCSWLTGTGIDLVA